MQSLRFGFLMQLMMSPASQSRPSLTISLRRLKSFHSFSTPCASRSAWARAAWAAWYSSSSGVDPPGVEVEGRPGEPPGERLGEAPGPGRAPGTQSSPPATRHTPARMSLTTVSGMATTVIAATTEATSKITVSCASGQAF